MSVEYTNRGHITYQKLPSYAELRHQELYSMLRPVVELTDSYGCLVTRAVLMLGKGKPGNRQEVVIRDLIADVFDFLYESRRPLFEGRPHVTFPLVRRAFESLSILCVAFQDRAFAEKWDRGSKIENSEVRKALARLPLYESEQATQEIYKFFSKGAHPNRGLVGERFLGDGNEFVLGSIGRPNLLLTVEHCINLVGMWFWFGAVTGLIVHPFVSKYDPSFDGHYSAVSGNAAGVKAFLVENFNRLLEEEANDNEYEG